MNRCSWSNNRNNNISAMAVFYKHSKENTSQCLKDSISVVEINSWDLTKKTTAKHYWIRCRNVKLNCRWRNRKKILRSNARRLGLSSSWKRWIGSIKLRWKWKKIRKCNLNNKTNSYHDSKVFGLIKCKTRLGKLVIGEAVFKTLLNWNKMYQSLP